MSCQYNYITIDQAGSRTTESVSVPYAQLVNAPINPKNVFDEGIAKIDLKDMYLPNYAMRISKGVFSHDAVFINTSANEIDQLGSCLFPDGHLTSQLYNHKFLVESTKGTQNFKYDPLNEIQHRISANTPFHIIHFSAQPSHFLQFLPEDESWSDMLKSKLSRGERLMGKQSTPILLAQERALQTILDCPLTGKLGELMIESAITQVILLQLHSLFQQEPVSTVKPISKRDIDMVQGLKEHLSTTFLNDHSLEQLSRHFGTNTNKLMTLFKKSFGKSIFDYINELKMEYARTLLKEEDKMVVEVARIIGYKNPHHFSTAFKKKFGINPSQIQ